MRQEKNKGGRPTTAKAPWGDLYRKIGGQGVLAKTLGVSTSTVTKWANEVHRIPELAKQELLRLCEHYGIKEGLNQLRSFHP